MCGGVGEEFDQAVIGPETIRIGNDEGLLCSLFVILLSREAGNFLQYVE